MKYRRNEPSLVRERNGAALGLIAELCAELAARGVDYCHWKSNPFLDRSASGDNDLDLLVSRHHAQEFCEILSRLGFKEALVPHYEELPGVQNFYGYDRGTGRLVHIHAHFQLVLGHDLSKNYRLPVEEQYLKSAYQAQLFRVPAPEFELVIFVIRMVLKHSTWDTMLMGHGKLSRSEQAELQCLTAPDVLAKADLALQELQIIDRSLFDLCLQSIRPGCLLRTRVRAGEQLQAAIAACARRSHTTDIAIKMWQRVWQPIQSRVFHYNPKKRFAHGGLFVAVVGGDGAGKTTMLEDLGNWLGETFEVTRLHMGKPKWSALTTLMRGVLKIGTVLHLYSFEGDIYEEATKPHGYPWFVRAACTARDRYVTFKSAQRDSANGKVVLCDRYSLPGFLATDGPQCEQAFNRQKANRFLSFLARTEASYYQRISLPDLLIVLKVDPEVAVQRKLDETAASVRARSAEVFEKDWSVLSGHVLDASQSKAGILAEAKALLWEYL